MNCVTPTAAPRHELQDPKANPMGLYHPLDGDTNLKYKLLCFLTLNKNNFKEEGTSF